MVQKHKNYTQILTTIASHLGLFVMLAASVANMAELAERESSKVAAVLQPHFSMAVQSMGNAAEGHGEESSRHAKEEVGHSAANYGAARRSPSVTGTF